MTPLRKWCEKRHVGPTKAYALLKTGQLHAVKLGRRTFITDEEDEKFLKSLPAYATEENHAASSKAKS